MLKINFTLLDQPIQIEDLTILVIEDVIIFSQIIRQVYQYELDGDFKIYNDRYESLKSSELVTITDIFGYDINSAGILKLIYADLEDQLNQQPEVKSMIDKLTSTITEIISYELIENEMDLEYDEITIQELFKSLGIKIEVKSDTIFDKVIEIIQVFKFLTKKKLLIFINVGTYLTKKEMKYLDEYVKLNHVKLLMIEGHRVEGMPQYILDSDYYLDLDL
ncbi:type II-A CRISPR-associated protein Csn2 [Enterococcus italicus]|uniref:CRISPR-associated protein, Csn2 family n=1 Tax=Enterococcus italicus (strain DSM 15952 / CCUG 50447 / LMG 22039 / TP 1.5) TaxID=888064 RepID=E6LHZ9_ENTI1|nr:type II-A CRISPR-associated protein Csn2 [Enterococcus italicus]EFU73165.1 CRISPR-associated protein, Csn2 family [Enterococcus italicus DSM 15952]